MNLIDTHRSVLSHHPSAPRCDPFQRELVALIPHLRAFSRSLCGRRDFAEDLAQEALLKAWRARDSFQSGTNLKAWLFTILRNAFHSQGRRAWREVGWDTEMAAQIEAPPNEQDWTIELSDVARALSGLPELQRESVILVGAGFSYKDAAEICHAPIGTMKSRVARGRTALLHALDGDAPLPPAACGQSNSAADDILAQMDALTRSVVPGAAAHL